MQICDILRFIKTGQKFSLLADNQEILEIINKDFD